MAAVTPEAFFIPDGDHFVPTELTRGPWDPKAQHGGPPAALLGTALEQCDRREDTMVVRVTFEILKPIPLAPLTVGTRMLRAGRSVQFVVGSLSVGGLATSTLYDLQGPIGRGLQSLFIADRTAGKTGQPRP